MERREPTPPPKEAISFPLEVGPQESRAGGCCETVFFPSLAFGENSNWLTTCFVVAGLALAATSPDIGFPEGLIRSEKDET